MHERLERAPLQQSIDVFLRLHLVEAVLGLALRYEVVLALEGCEFIVGEFAPLSEDFGHNIFSVFGCIVLVDSILHDGLHKYFSGHELKSHYQNQSYYLVFNFVFSIKRRKKTDNESRNIFL